jgi:hypothetical protein
MGAEITGQVAWLLLPVMAGFAVMSIRRGWNCGGAGQGGIDDETNRVVAVLFRLPILERDRLRLPQPQT